MSIINLVALDPQPPGVNVLKAERCSSSDALSTSDHSVERFTVLDSAIEPGAPPEGFY